MWESGKKEVCYEEKIVLKTKKEEGVGKKGTWEGRKESWDRPRNLYVQEHPLFMIRKIGTFGMEFEKNKLGRSPTEVSIIPSKTIPAEF